MLLRRRSLSWLGSPGFYSFSFSYQGLLPGEGEAVSGVGKWNSLYTFGISGLTRLLSGMWRFFYTFLVWLLCLFPFRPPSTYHHPTLPPLLSSLMEKVCGRGNFLCFCPPPPLPFLFVLCLGQSRPPPGPDPGSAFTSAPHHKSPKASQRSRLTWRGKGQGWRPRVLFGWGYSLLCCGLYSTVPCK